MIIERRFSDKGLTHIRWWTWGAALLPITGLALMFFIWFFGIKELVDVFMISISTIMFCAAALWWWWIIWVVSRLLRKERYIAVELKNTVDDIKDLKVLVQHNFNIVDK